MKKRRAFIFVLLFSILLTGILSRPAAAMTFPDVKATDAYYDAVQKLYDNGVVDGYPDGTFRPDSPITRAELVKMVNIAFGYIGAGSQNPFVDVKPGDWFYSQVLTAAEKGYILGFPDGTFQGNSHVTREQMCVILDRILPLSLTSYVPSISDPVPAWSRSAVEKVVYNWIWPLDSKGRFRATENATRAEVSVALAQYCVESTQGVMRRVIRQLEADVLPGRTEAQAVVVQEIINNMQSYLANANYDYRPAAEETRRNYANLPEGERGALKLLITRNCLGEDLIRLQDYFFPEDIKI